MTDNYKDIDLELEKVVFLYNAKEGNSGIYELTWELAYYDLTIESKYNIAHKILTGLLSDRLVILDKYSDLALENKIETIPLDKTEDILNNPNSWYPCNEIVSMTLTEKGENYLNEQVLLLGDRLNERWTGKKEI
jgi:uncharacterized protein YkvS